MKQVLSIENLRKKTGDILVIGNHPGIIQSILDFDYLSGKKPSIIGIIATGRKTARYFFGKREILVSFYPDVSYLPKELKRDITYVLNLSSGRRVLSSTIQLLEELPNLEGGSVFAEEVPELHSLEVHKKAAGKNIFMLGPASVGIIIPGILKLGAIGGTESTQLVDSHLFEKGDVAVMSSSGGMTNEIIRAVALQNRRISFALSFGGERYPVVTPKDAFLAAENDSATKTIVYFGELGGNDEYELVALLKDKKITKEVICYIAGTVAEIFETPPQFGHAKAMAKTSLETAQAKKDALKKAGAKIANSFADFVKLIGSSKAKKTKENKQYSIMNTEMTDRSKALFATTISGDVEGEARVLGEDLAQFAKRNSFAYIVVSLFLGKKIHSKRLEECVDFILRQLVDHGPYVSGAVNTIIASRAGKDLVSSLSAGLLTIGPRFGGAINQAAVNWLDGVTSNKNPYDFVEEFAKRKEYISGIGHRKYRIDYPDPRLRELLKFANTLPKKRFSTFAQSIEKITAAKKGNLILNVDGAIAAVLLDILSEEEGLSDEELKNLAGTEFFNALFVLSRSVGFIAHYLDQKRLDEGLFRLDEDLVAHTK